MKLELICSSCGNKFLKLEKEVKRQQKNKGTDTPFYCSSKCQGDARRIIKLPVSKTCECGNGFETTTDASYCGRNCASKYSGLEIRSKPEFIEKLINSGIKSRFSHDNLDKVANSLRVREWSKYDLVHHYLLICSISHSFEYSLPNTRWIYDLAIHDLSLLIEFDESYHKSIVDLDIAKEQDANKEGWNLVRVDVTKESIPYSPNLIKNLLVSYE